MKGKIAFVFGAAVGYVLGTRAGRERYEQIKRGAETLWNTPPVQRGADAVKGVAQDRLDQLKAAAARTGRSMVLSLFGGEQQSVQQAPAERTVAATEPAVASKGAETKAAPKPKAAASKAAASKTAAKPKATAKPKAATSKATSKAAAKPKTAAAKSTDASSSSKPGGAA